MSEEQKKILKMVAEGKLSPEEADRLLGAIKSPSGKTHFLHVRVFDKRRNKPKVNINIPLSVLKLASKISSAFKGVIPKESKIHINDREIQLDELTPEMLDQIIEKICDGGKYTLVEVKNEENDEEIEVYVE